MPLHPTYKADIQPIKSNQPASKQIYNQIEHFHFKTQYYSGDKKFWQVQNNQFAPDAINQISSRNKAISIATFDISTIQTNIPNKKVKINNGRVS